MKIHTNPTPGRPAHVRADIGVRVYAPTIAEATQDADVLTHTVLTALTDVDLTPRPVSDKPLTLNVLEPGARGELVRELQHRLYQEKVWWPETTTGVYGPDTWQAVTDWQTKRGLPPTGVVDPRSWQTLRSMTETPTHDQKHNIKPKRDTTVALTALLDLGEPAWSQARARDLIGLDMADTFTTPLP